MRDGVSETEQPEVEARMRVARADLDAWSERTGIPALPRDEARSRRIIRLKEHLFASWQAETPPYDFAALMEEAWTKAEDGDWLIGIDGYGFQNWALHWVQRRGPLLFGFQLPFGGAFAAHDADREVIEGAFGLIDSMNAALDRAAAAGRLPDDRILVVLDTGFRTGRYAWIPRGGRWRDAAWREDPMAALAGLIELEALCDPRSA